MKHLPTFQQFVNKLFTSESSKIDREIDILTEERGFEIVDIYDLENISGVSTIKLNQVTPTFLYDRSMNEAVDFELPHPGGVIVFSADLNATLGSAKTLGEKVKFFFTSKWKTFLNRLNTSKRLRSILVDDFELPGYSVGKSFSGVYPAKNGMIFDEKSYTIDIAGVDSNELILISTEICRELKQETVMVRDFNKGSRPKVYFVNDKKVVKDKI